MSGARESGWVRSRRNGSGTVWLERGSVADLGQLGKPERRCCRQRMEIVPDVASHYATDGSVPGRCGTNRVLVHRYRAACRSTTPPPLFCASPIATSPPPVGMGSVNASDGPWWPAQRATKNAAAGDFWFKIFRPAGRNLLRTEKRCFRPTFAGRDDVGSKAKMSAAPTMDAGLPPPAFGLRLVGAILRSPSAWVSPSFCAQIP